jgi:hypothetical protein
MKTLLFALLFMGLIFAENLTINTTSVEVLTYNYETPTQISVFSWDFMFGLVLILIGIAGMYIFAIMGE